MFEWVKKVSQTSQADCSYGLYRPEEHDACGVGFVAQLGKPPSNSVLQQALVCLENLTHRGGVDADGASGDGAGVMVQLPSAFFGREACRLDSSFNPEWRLAVGVFFLPRDTAERARAMQIAEDAVRRRGRGLYLAGWRPLPRDERALGPQARETQPCIWHLLVADRPESGRAPGDGSENGGRQFEERLYLVRKEIEHRLRS